MSEIGDACNRFARGDVWTSDEAGLNYTMYPDRTIRQTDLSDRKKDKRRLIILVCQKATGVQKFPLIYVGKSQKPSRFIRSLVRS